MSIVVRRKKPVAVRTLEWTGENFEEVRSFTRPENFRLFNDTYITGLGYFFSDPDITAVVWDKLHSTWVGVKTGQHIIEGVVGELYPCDDDVIEMTYEVVEV